MSKTHDLGEEYGATARTDATGSWWLSPSSNTDRRLYTEDEMRDLYDLLSDEFDEDDSGGGPATELLTNLEFDFMNTRPLDELFEDHGRVMADNNRPHDHVVTMSDVEAEIQSLCVRVSDLERGKEQ